MRYGSQGVAWRMKSPSGASAAPAAASDARGRTTLLVAPLLNPDQPDRDRLLPTRSGRLDAPNIYFYQRA
jgi:hypothetical protein